MIQPSTLFAARAELLKAEKDLRDPAKLAQLRNSINFLFQVMSGVSPRIEKDIAKRLVLTYRNKILAEAKAILLNRESYEPGYLEHWKNTMEAFVDTRINDDSDFRACKDRLFTTVTDQPVNHFTPRHTAIQNEEPEPALPQNDFYFRKTKEFRKTLHAQFLSALGAYLEILRIQAFELEKKGDFYVVRSEDLSLSHEPMLRNHFNEATVDSGVFNRESATIAVGDGWLCYGPLTGTRLNDRDLQRHTFEESCERGKLVQLLGTIGKYLDSHKPTAFKISWHPDSVSAEYHSATGAIERRDFTVTAAGIVLY